MNWLHFAIGIMANALQAAVKNPQSLATEKTILLEIRNTINGLFPGE